ncbi:glutamyl-tRNA synthetase [Basidiobolus meristosporus CBS 931.73]|uniref:Probable glutamate--tRNA ligase, cytoplasmic n=1 Tax=Basidiobolus meristosporus CBS 931.73 TaxID=1314790 RepID=A0A1Y1Z6D8_9FUNG|nr:glutamyl-tRNA synthetase [Basidiobolus meristosporus CBS 931.73]|eukprot:ORY05776.1 glutamyl-tRNA synthetase [Basidiobolus meristosporus CBS 931.73]
MASIVIAHKANPLAYAPLALAFYLKTQSVEVKFEDADSLKDGANAQLIIGSETFVGDDIYKQLSAKFADTLGEFTAESEKALEKAKAITAADFKSLNAITGELDHFLTMRSFVSGYKLSVADFALFGALKANAVFSRQLKTNQNIGTHLARWFQFIASLDCVKEALVALQQSIDSVKDRKDQGSFDIDLKGAKMGEVVTRFPPEPSGYLHIGHAKAALLNQYFAETYKGKMIVRFDDTNPSKEKVEYEESIKEDLKLIGVDSDNVTHTSDYFDQLYEHALQLIKKGLAYADDTDQATMRDQRMHGVPSKNRDNSVEENLRRFEEMTKGTEFGQTNCLRAKISVDNKNKALRDPVIYRCNLLPHHLVGDKWKVYPTYDFACPIVDSLEGVTHALRTNEYRDRNPQYEWMLEATGVRKVHIWDFSRMNFVYTLLSKRKLQWFVDQGLVTGWDDPRFPTVRGIRRRGMTIEALKQYILMQGASQNVLMLEWDKLWALNKKVIDPVSPRHTAVAKDNMCKVTIVGGPEKPYVKDMPKHKKNPEVGLKKTVFSSTIYIEQDDAKALQAGEEVTLMDWGNAIVSKDFKVEEGQAVESVTMELHLEGDFKKTKKKITWLAADGQEEFGKLVNLELLDYDYLITKKKLEEDDEIKDVITPVTEFKSIAVGDANLAEVKVGDIIQLERKGYYIADQAASADLPLKLIRIPDGKANTMASKADDSQSKKAKAPKKEKKEKKAKEQKTQ